MAYARFGPDSDVYVYAGARGYVCCACPMRERPGDFVCEDARAMMSHLREHSVAGHRFPPDAVVRLAVEAGRP